jgi:hypothetical protein
MAYILLLSDLHVGSDFGVFPRVAYRQEHNERIPVRPNKGQRYLLQCWEWMMAHLPPRLTYTIVNGDIIDGENPREGGLYLSLHTPTDQVEAAVSLLGPLRERSDAFFIVKGTPYHGGRADDALAGLAKALHATRWASGSRTGTRLWLHMKKAGGKVLNASHHITRGWMYASAVADRTVMMAAAAEATGKLPRADIIVRSHLHLKRVVHVENKHVILTPAWKLLTPFAERAMEEIRAEFLSDLGAILVEVTSKGQVFVDGETFAFPNFHPQITKA